MVALAAMTKGWTGAEIEQAVVSARIEALHEGVPMTMDHLVTAIGQIVPLSKTMEDQIKAIKAWAYDRALPASSSAARRYR
jgi:vesicle-fusing ATPase